MQMVDRFIIKSLYFRCLQVQHKPYLNLIQRINRENCLVQTVCSKAAATMPFLGTDWRGPGYQWARVGSSKWEIIHQNFGVISQSLPRSHVKKVIESFLRQVQQKKNQSMYTNLTSAPVSKSSVREEMSWLQIGLKGSNEVHGYTTLGEMIRRLDLAEAAALSHRFRYILKITELLVKHKIANLSGMAQSHLFLLMNSLLQQVLESKIEIRQMHHILNRVMKYFQVQSNKTFFSSKTMQFHAIEEVRKMQTKLKLITVPQRVDRRATLCNLPIEVQRNIITHLNDFEDIKSVSLVNHDLHMICEETSTWRNLCCKNYYESQIKMAKIALTRKTLRKSKQEVPDGQSTSAISENNYINPTSTKEWKNVHAICRRLFDKREESYSDPLLYCRRCSILYWKDTGHPCIREVQNLPPDMDELSPKQIISMFEY